MILAMHEAKSVNSQSIKNLRRTFFKCAINWKGEVKFEKYPLVVEVTLKMQTFYICVPFVKKFAPDF